MGSAAAALQCQTLVNLVHVGFYSNYRLAIDKINKLAIF